MPVVEIVGYAAAFSTTMSFLPQAIKVIRTRDTSSLSLVMYLVFNFGVLLWLFYGIMRNDPVIILANTVTLLFSVSILTIKVANVLKSKEG